MDNGRLFRNPGAATENAISPYFVAVRLLFSLKESEDLVVILVTVERCTSNTHYC